MCNLDIRDDLKKNGVYQWQVAHELGICEMTLARWLRFEMSEEKKHKVFEAIKRAAENFGKR